MYLNLDCINNKKSIGLGGEKRDDQVGIVLFTYPVLFSPVFSELLKVSWTLVGRSGSCFFCLPVVVEQSLQKKMKKYEGQIQQSFLS